MIGNEHLLCHGSASVKLDTIMREGFDLRVSSQFGSMGAGMYVAWRSWYCRKYSVKARTGSGTRLDVGLSAEHG